MKPVLATFLDKPGSGEAWFNLFSASLDETTTQRRGARFGPMAVRLQSAHLETFNPATGLDWEDIELVDHGEVEFTGVEDCLEAVSKAVGELGGLPILLGGEHTVTLGALRGLKPTLALVFDAHLDLRDELWDIRVGHATWLRRAVEEGVEALVVGARALSREEVEYVASNGEVAYISAQEFRRRREECLREIRARVEPHQRVYVSLDMDVLDPAFAPAVGNPSPGGLTTWELEQALEAAMGGPVVGLDLCEVYPHYDHGVTAATGAHLVLWGLHHYLASHGEGLGG